MIIIEKIYKTLEENINKIKFEYKYSKDLTFKYLKINTLNISLVYLNTLASDDAINNYILKSLNDLIKTKKKLKYKNILKVLYQEVILKKKILLINYMI